MRDDIAPSRSVFSRYRLRDVQLCPGGRADPDEPDDQPYSHAWIEKDGSSLTSQLTSSMKRRHSPFSSREIPLGTPRLIRLRVSNRQTSDVLMDQFGSTLPTRPSLRISREKKDNCSPLCSKPNCSPQRLRQLNVASVRNSSRVWQSIAGYSPMVICGIFISRMIMPTMLLPGR